MLNLEYYTVDDVKTQSNAFSATVFQEVMKDPRTQRKCKDGVAFVQQNKKVILAHASSLCTTLPEKCHDLFNTAYVRKEITYYLADNEEVEAFTLPTLTDISLLYDYGKTVTTATN